LWVRAVFVVTLREPLVVEQESFANAHEVPHQRSCVIKDCSIGQALRGVKPELAQVIDRPAQVDRCLSKMREE